MEIMDTIPVRLPVECYEYEPFFQTLALGGDEDPEIPLDFKPSSKLEEFHLLSCTDNSESVTKFTNSDYICFPDKTIIVGYTGPDYLTDQAIKGILLTKLQTLLGTIIKNTYKRAIELKLEHKYPTYKTKYVDGFHKISTPTFKKGDYEVKIFSDCCGVAWIGEECKFDIQEGNKKSEKYGYLESRIAIGVLLNNFEILNV